MSNREPQNPSQGPLAHTVEDASRHANCGRTTIFAEMKSGALPAHKIGRRTIILDEDLRAWLRSLPTREVA